MQLAASIAPDMDSVRVDPAHHTVVFENEQVRVVRWVVAARDSTLNHTHPNNLNINLTDYDGKVTTPEGTMEVHDQAGSVSWRPAGKHAVENLSHARMEGIIVEPKMPASARPAGSHDPIVVDAQHQQVVFENEQLRVIREHWQAGETPMHGHPDSLQVLLTDMQCKVTSADGRSETVAGKAGEVRFRPATQHGGEFLGDKVIEQIVVELKGIPISRAGS